MKNILAKLVQKKYAHFWILFVIILVGIFFRTYHFSEWLPFKGDAFRDATLISNTYRVGVASLPLLGPRAGGTMLRLGPVFYDFQYAAALIFHGVSAPILAYPDLFFSIMTIPMLYLFSRRYFSIQWSLAMAAMLSVSFLAIEYGRFAWNPNATLFFTLVFSYALLRLYDLQSQKQRPLLWAFIAGTALAIASQLHFSAFLGLPMILILFLFLRFEASKKVLSFQIIFIFLASIVLVYMPVFASEFFKHGENTHLFLSAIFSKASSQGMYQNVHQTALMFAKYYLRIDLGTIEPGRIFLLFSGIFCIVGYAVNALLFYQEKSEGKRNFLLWTLILITVYFLLYIPLAFKIDRPRFFLPFMMLPYIYFGYIMVFFQKHVSRPRLMLVATLVGIGIIGYGNIRATTSWFVELHNSQQTFSSTGEKNSKGKSFWLTWGHFERAATAIDTTCGQQGIIYFSMAKNIKAYDHSIEYALLLRRAHRASENIQPTLVNEQSECYYYISFPKDALPDFISQGRKDAPVDVGNLQVLKFYPEDAAREAFIKNRITVKREVRNTAFEPEKITRYSRVYWGDIWYRLH